MKICSKTVNQNYKLKDGFQLKQVLINFSIHILQKVTMFIFILIFPDTMQCTSHCHQIKHS